MSRHLLQTWKSTDLSTAPPIFRICQPSWQRYHPQWAYTLIDDDGIERYVRAHFPSFWQDSWQQFPPGIERADLIRYLFLFREGGLYADLDFECLRPFDAVLEDSTTDVVLGRLRRPRHPEGHPNALLAARRPCQLFWLLVLEEAMKAVGAARTVERTGPVVLGRAIDAYRAGPPPPSSLRVTSLLDVDTGSVVDGGLTVLPPEAVYPICWLSQQWKRRLFLRLRPHLSHEQLKTLFPRALAVTYWTHAWEDHR